MPLKRNPPSKDVFAKELQKAFPDIIPCVEHNKYYTEEVWKGIDFRYGSHTDPVDAIENRGDVPDDNDGCDHQTADVDAVVRPVKTTAIPSRTADMD